MTEPLLATRVEGGSVPPPAGQAVPPTARIDRFLILRNVGAGGMGVVYAAFDEELDRKVAIKLLRSGLRDTATASARMQREAQAMARLSHPNVVQIHQVGVFGDRVFIAMEYIEGHNAREWQALGPRRWQEVLAIYLQAGRGLAAAHEAGLIHRDFKPDNVLVGGDDRVRVADFGLARANEEEDAEAVLSAGPWTSSISIDMRLTATQAIVGTPAYMAPEQHLRTALDARADQYSFCAALYEALYGVLPHAGNDRQEICAAMLRGEIQAPARPRKFSPRIHAAILRGLAVDPRQRWPDMNALLGALDPRPNRAPLIGLTLASLLAAGAVGASLFSHVAPAEPACDSAARIDPVWGPEQRLALHAGLTGTGLPLAAYTAARVTEVLDDFADAWAHMYTDACRAHHLGEQSSELFDRRMTCLARRLADLDATVDVVGTADAAVAEHAIQAALALPAIASCADSEALLSQLTPPAGLTAAVLEQRADLSRVESNRRAGRLEAALPLAVQAVASARALGYEPLIAEALMQRGNLEDDLGRALDAHATYDEAYALALSLGHDVVAADIATLQLFLMSSGLGKPEVAEAWALQAEALLRRTTAAPAAWSYFYQAMGALHSRKEDFVRAREYHQKALAMVEKIPRGSRAAIAGVLNNLATAANSLGRYDLATKEYGQAIEALTAELGPDHPVLVVLKTNLGNNLLNAGQFAASEQMYRDALALCERLHGPQHVHCELPLTGLGTLLGNLHRDAEAEQYLRRAVENCEAARVPNPRRFATIVFNLGCVLQERGDLAGAQAYVDRARQIHTELYGESYRLLPFELTQLASIAVARGDLVTARSLLETALTYRESHPVEPEELASTRFDLARALGPQRADRARAHALARAAESTLRDLPEQAERHAEVLAWLARHAP